MQLRTIHILFFISFLFLLFYSCKKKESANDIQCGNMGWTNDSITYSKTISTIMLKNCIRCHSNSIKKGWVDLEGYDRVKKYADNHKLLGTIAHLQGFKAMPRGAAMVSQEDICRIKFWIDNGGQNN